MEKTQIIEDYCSKIEQKQRQELIQDAIKNIGDLSNEDMRDLLGFIHSLSRKKMIGKVPALGNLYWMLQVAGRCGTAVQSARIIKTAWEDKRMLVLMYSLSQLGLALI